MMEFAKDLVSNIGHSGADAARFVGGKTADMARYVGGGTVDLAKRVGPKRGIIGFVVIGGAAVGGYFLWKYLRARAADAEAAAGADGFKSDKVKNAAKRAENEARSMPH